MGFTDRTNKLIFAALAVAGLGGIAVSQRQAPAIESPGRTAPASNRISGFSRTSAQALTRSADVEAQSGNGGTVCKDAVSATGRAMLQSSAENKAKGSWHGVAASAYGGTWDWNTASGHAINCTHNKLGPLERRWTCTATAQPCEEVLACDAGWTTEEGASAKLQSGAETNAINKWQNVTNASWANAANRVNSCRHNGLGPLERRWRCTARARACR